MPVDFDKSTIPAKIAAMCLSVTMEITVVLVNSSSTDQPQVSPRDEAAPLIKNLLLRLDVDVSCLMQDSHD